MREGVTKMVSLSADNLAIVYRDAHGIDFTALDVTALRFAPGRLAVVAGPSGCGKSSLLCGLSGLATPKTGRVLYGAQDVFALGPAARDGFRRLNIGFVFQDFQLVRELSPLENVLLPARFDRFALPAAMVARGRALLSEHGVPERGAVAEL